MNQGYSVSTVGDIKSPLGIGGLWPTDETRITSAFGPRTHPVTGKVKNHNGIDIGTHHKTGVEVLAPVSGTISVSTSDAGGVTATITSGKKRYTLCHLSKILAKDGSRVRMGDLIALSGNTGASSGPHLHFGIWDDSMTPAQPIDPMDYWWLKIDGFKGTPLRDPRQSVAATDSPDGGTSALGVTRGRRNNNPLNVRKNERNDWKGVIRPGADSAFEQFESLAWGYRCALYLLTKFIRGGCDTLRSLITRWAPPSENNTASYITHVSRELNISPDAKLDADDEASMKALVLAMSTIESGATGPEDVAAVDDAWTLLN